MLLCVVLCSRFSYVVLLNWFGDAGWCECSTLEPPIRSRSLTAWGYVVLSCFIFLFLFRSLFPVIAYGTILDCLLCMLHRSLGQALARCMGRPLEQAGGSGRQRRVCASVRRL